MAQYDCPDSWSGSVAVADAVNALQTGTAALTKYTNTFFIPFLTSIHYLGREESLRIWKRSPLDTLLAYAKLGQMNLELAERALNGGRRAMNQFIEHEIREVLPALSKGDAQAWSRWTQRINRLVEGVTKTYPAAIDEIGSDFGFHFERQPSTSRVDETGRFVLYQVLPTDPKVSVRKDGKPILIVPPVVLGANILSFLPGENRSYAHAYANKGIPTYIKIYKDIETCEDVQLMTLEDDANDTRRFCEVLQKRHQAQVTLNGYCQGGYAVLCMLLSGKLDGLVDSLITCVAPMDGTRSRGLAHFISLLPPVLNDLSYGTKVLPNGNRVADGVLMGWIYKLTNIEMESPVTAMWRDTMLAKHAQGNADAINKTAAALNHWLLQERNDFPLEITKTSFTSYNIPIAGDGTLPVQLFGQNLNLKRLEAKKIRWLICYGMQDDLVEPQTALAPLDFVDAEVTGFPKGHVAMATSWSHPESEFALHRRYENGKGVGPVRFQLDLQEALDRSKQESTVAPARTKNPKPAPPPRHSTVATKAAPKTKKPVPKAKAAPRTKTVSKAKATPRSKMVSKAKAGPKAKKV